jgi:hypothetical protein
MAIKRPKREIKKYKKRNFPPLKPIKEKLPRRNPVAVASSMTQGPTNLKRPVVGKTMSAQERRMMERMFNAKSTMPMFNSSRANNKAENKRNSRRA